MLPKCTLHSLPSHGHKDRYTGVQPYMITALDTLQIHAKLQPCMPTKYKDILTEANSSNYHLPDP